HVRPGRRRGTADAARSMEVIEGGHDLVPDFGQPVEPVVLPGVHGDTRRRPDAEGASRRHRRRDPDLGRRGAPVSRRGPLSLIPSPSDRLDYPREETPGIGVEAEGYALPRLEVFQAV